MAAWLSRVVTSFLLVFDCMPYWWPGILIALEITVGDYYRLIGSVIDRRLEFPLVVVPIITCH